MAEQKTYFHHSMRLLSLGIPLVGGHLAGFAIHMSDTIMLGWYSVEALAAGVLGSTFFFVLFIFLSGFGQAVMPVVASAEASGQTRQVRRVTRMAMWLSILAGVLALPLFLWSDAILDMLGQPPDVAALAGDYLRIVGYGMVPALLVMVFRSYLSALERTQVVLWVTVLALLANILVNYALIFGNWGAPEMGVRGAAIASITVQIVSILGVAVYAALVTPEHELFVRFWRPDWEAFGTIFSLGWPIGLTTLSEVSLFAASSVMMGWLGTLSLAAHGIAIQIASIFFLVHLGLANAATIRVGQAAGRKDRGALRQVIISANMLSLAFALISIVIYLTLGPQMIGLFLDPGEPSRAEVISIGAVLLMVAAAFQLGDAGQVQALSHLRGLHDTRVPMVMAAISYWGVGLPASYALGFVVGWGGVGIWAGLTIGLACAWVLMGGRLYRMVFSSRATVLT